MVYVIANIAAGVLTGLVTGFTGANGIAVGLSILLLAGLQVHNVIGQCLSVQVFTMLITLIPLVRKAGLSWKLVPMTCLPAVLTSYVGARVALYTPDLLLEVLVIVLLFVVGVLLLRSKPLISDTGRCKTTEQPGMRDLVNVGLAGVISGFMAGMVGGGGNIIVANALNRFLCVAFRRALALSLCLGITAASIGMIPYVQSGRVDPSAMLWMLVPSLTIAAISSHWSCRVPVSRIRRMQGIYLIGVVTLLAGRLVL